MKIACSAYSLLPLLLTVWLLSTSTAADLTEAVKQVGFPLDPVALIAGQKVAGNSKFSADHHRFRYIFASQANLDAFQAEPDKYAVALGGACARMGSLNSGGRADLHAVVDGKLYLFASDQCRATFQRDFAKLLWRPEPALALDEDSRRRGNELLDRAVTAAGGKNRLLGLSEYTESRTSKVKNADREYRVVKSLQLTFPNSFDRTESWDDDSWTRTAGASSGQFLSKTESVAMHPEQLREQRALLGHHWLSLLRLAAGGQLVASAEPVDAASETLEVEVFSFDVRSKLIIDAKSNRLIRFRYRDRGPNAAIGEVEQRFSDFRTVAGVNAPHSVAVSFDGQAWNDESGQWTEISLK